MKIKRYVRSYFLYILIVLLLISISVSAFAFVTISKRDKTIADANKQIASANEEIEETNSKLSEKEKENENLISKLEKAESENSKLEKENKNYQKEIEKLSLEKQIEAEKNVANKNSPQSAYPKPDKVCYLTFDDGPSDNTLKILKILKKYKAKATFFVIGTAKLQYLSKIKEGGHAIGLHSDTHTYKEIYKNSNAYFKDLKKISDKIENITGDKVNILRFPGGSSNKVNSIQGGMRRLITQVKAKGYAYFDWNVDSTDASARRVSAKTITKNVLSQAKNKNSICVLMHDTSIKTTTVDALPEIIDGLKKQGYYFDVLTEKTYSYSLIK